MTTGKSRDKSAPRQALAPVLVPDNHNRRQHSTPVTQISMELVLEESCELGVLLQLCQHTQPHSNKLWDVGLMNKKIFLQRYLEKIKVGESILERDEPYVS